MARQQVAVAVAVAENWRPASEPREEAAVGNLQPGSLALASYCSLLFLRQAVVLKSTIPRLPIKATLDPIKDGSGS
jgi:hypothetical protein